MNDEEIIKGFEEVENHVNSFQATTEANFKEIQDALVKVGVWFGKLERKVKELEEQKHGS